MAADTSDFATIDLHANPKGQPGTLGRSLQIEDSLDSVSKDSLDMGYNSPEASIRPCGEKQLDK